MLLFITYVFIFSDVGIIAKIKLTQKMHDLENQMLNLENENKILQTTIEKLKYDKTYIAERARDLGYAQKSEKIYRFYEEKFSNTNIRQTNNKFKALKFFKFKDYLAYIIVFLIVIIIYILLIFYHKSNYHKD